MAFTKFLIVAAVLVAATNAKFVWKDEPKDDFFSNPFKIQMPFPPTPPRPPFQPFQPYQQPFQPFQPFAFAPFSPFPPNFVNFPKIPMPQVLSPDQIKNTKPGPNQMFTGSVVKSESRVVMGPDGKPIRHGGTSILSNVDGKVTELKDGSAPPDLSKPIKVGQPW